MSRYGDDTDKQYVYEQLSYIRDNLNLSIKEFSCVVMQVLSDMMESNYDYYGEIE